MKYLIILCRVLLCAMLLLLTLSKPAPTDTLPEAIPDTTTLSATDFAMPTLPEGNVHKKEFLNYIPVLAIAFAVILLVDTVYLFITLRKVKSREQIRRKKYEGTDKEPRQVRLSITCDDGYTADFLRELANHIEERDEDDFHFEYKTFRGCAEITTED